MSPLHTAHLCQLLFDRLDVLLKQIGPHQTHSTVDVKTNTACKPKKCYWRWYNSFKIIGRDAHSYYEITSGADASVEAPNMKLLDLATYILVQKVGNNRPIKIQENMTRSL